MLQRFCVVLALFLGLALVSSSASLSGPSSPDAPAELSAEEEVILDQAMEQVAITESVEEPGNEVAQALEEVPELPEVEIPDSVNVTLDTVWEKSADDMPLFDRLVKAVLRSRTLPSEKDKNGKKKPPKFYWEQGGVPVPEDQLIPLASKWVAVFLASLDQVKDQTGIQLPTWGAIATIANESGFWQCSLNFEARKWAAGHSCKKLQTETWHGKTVRRKIETKLVDKFRQTYTCDEVWEILTDPHYKDAKVEIKGRDGKMKMVKLRNMADGGPWQQRFSMKTMTKARFDLLMSMEPGVYLGSKEMVRRSVAYVHHFKAKEPHPRPWMLWPGWNPNTDRSIAYDAKITSIARWLGARREEIERGAMVVDPVKQRRLEYEERNR